MPSACYHLNNLLLILHCFVLSSVCLPLLLLHRCCIALQVYTYSIFHIFFEQYLNTHRDAALLVGLPLLAVFVTAWIFTGGGG